MVLSAIAAPIETPTPAFPPTPTAAETAPTIAEIDASLTESSFTSPVAVIVLF